MCRSLATSMKKTGYYPVAKSFLKYNPSVIDPVDRYPPWRQVERDPSFLCRPLGRVHAIHTIQPMVATWGIFKLGFMVLNYPLGYKSIKKNFLNLREFFSQSFSLCI
ncbi:Hypothetical protein Minf_2234 [Methylacidiphilum infernorum V4]|uniref:Uncharacterized protein n=1 Tax=Methylacidiphilum infernorum (isolate V4) TaxID=481448 RepID=B3DZV3_METI4|nr:Hypothetical protein Minf_2234 [Methylacidiphilum infernorum V4]